MLLWVGFEVDFGYWCGCLVVVVVIVIGVGVDDVVVVGFEVYCVVMYVG